MDCPVIKERFLLSNSVLLQGVLSVAPAFSSTTTRARASNSPGYTPGLHALSWGRKSTDSEFVLFKARAFKIVQNYGHRTTIG
jgi:hypothetical protein